MDECIFSLGEAEVFSTLNANSSYWQAEVKETNRNKTAFTSYHGLHRFVQMLSGLKNIPGTFQWAMEVIMSLVKWQSALVYLDDIVVFSRSLRNQINHVKQVLSILKDAGVTLKLMKCNFFTETIDYLGHVIRLRRLEIATHTTAAIKKLKLPTNIT